MTDGQEENPDPLEDATFPGIRLSLDYRNPWGKVTTCENDRTIHVNVTDIQDHSFDMVNAIPVRMTEKLAPRVRLRWLYDNEPALEDIDLVAFVQVIDPDAIPGSGDELFSTTAPGPGTAIEIGEVRERKKPLDSIFKTSRTIRFRRRCRARENPAPVGRSPVRAGYGYGGIRLHLRVWF